MNRPTAGHVRTRSLGSIKMVTTTNPSLATGDAIRRRRRLGFASPLKLGRLPWSYPWVWQIFTKAAKNAGIGSLGTHTMRHSYRSWLDAVGTPMAVQQKLMRHASITTTMNIYGDVVTDEMAQAHSKVVQLALTKQ